MYMTDKTTIQLPCNVRDKVKQAAYKRAKKMKISSLSMADYLSIVSDEE